MRRAPSSATRCVWTWTPSQRLHKPHSATRGWKDEGCDPDRCSGTTQLLQSVFAERIHMEIGASDRPVELGMDSLMAALVGGEIRRRYNVPLRVSWEWLMTLTAEEIATQLVSASADRGPRTADRGPRTADKDHTTRIAEEHFQGRTYASSTA
ncbi:acyl carrier protein [Streptomyces sp. NPDC015127]|uniref:acyl carrier protein n=1 Tax=Streptomyces sp. NPDC015127 TaxID=3364939 RepID=UPI0036FE0524